MVQEQDFARQEAEVPALQEGQLRVRVEYVAFEPAMRGWMMDRPSYIPPVALGEVMRAAGVGRIEESRAEGFAVGDRVSGLLCWQDYAVVDPSDRNLGLLKVPSEVKPTWLLGPLGLTGMTAYFGLFDVGRPEPGETVVISGAAGATGSVAAQLAKIHGCRVIGIAGGPTKCAWLTEKAGLDGAIDYKAGGVGKALREMCPDGINVYFDNVGGEILDAALANLALRGRVVLCGGISTYNDESPAPGPRNYLNLLVQRARMEGFIVFDFAQRYAEAREKIGAWIQEGKLVHEEDVQTGFDSIPRTFLRLFSGQNLGKQLLKLDT